MTPPPSNPRPPNSLHPKRCPKDNNWNSSVPNVVGSARLQDNTYRKGGEIIPHKMKAVSADLLDQAQVQLNVRIPVWLAQELDNYFAYLDRPYEKRLKESKKWPTSKQALILVALVKFLEEHPRIDRPGPEPDPPKPAIPKLKPRPKTIKSTTGMTRIP